MLQSVNINIWRDNIRMLQDAVNVSVTAIIPSDRDTADVIPGDFSTVNADGEPEMLESAGKYSEINKKRNITKTCTRNDCGDYA